MVRDCGKGCGGAAGTGLFPLGILPAHSPKQNGTRFLHRVQASPKSKGLSFFVLLQVSFDSLH